MTELSREELIGAYLDGELSSEQKARAEQLLAESAESRQMLDELRALRSNLQALPRMTLPDDFSQRVLQRAEREMLLGSPASATTRAAVERRETAAPATVLFGNRWLRPLVYAGFAVAAALLIALFLPSEMNDKTNFALRKDDRATSATPAIPNEEQIAATSDRQPESALIPKSAPAMAAEDRSVPAFKGGAPGTDKRAGAALAADEAGDAHGADDLLIVDLQITQSAFARGEFEQLLRAAEIEIAGPPATAPAEFKEGEKLSSPREEPASLEAAARSKKDRQPGALPLPANAEMFYVEATSEQLEAALASIDTKNADFPALVIEPAAGDDVQMKWRMEFRRIPAAAQTEVAEDELSRKLRREVHQVLKGARARDEAQAAQSSDNSTARRIDASPADTDAPVTTPEPEGTPARDTARSRLHAVFVLRVVADEEPAPTQAPDGVE